MIISLIGYMGSGKSHVSKVLSRKLDLKLIDLDEEIILRNKLSITEIFQKRGEIYFRKEERAVLIDILKNESDCVLSLGGGTPSYYDNIELVNKYTKSVYLQTSIKSLTERILMDRESRPLLAKLKDHELPEFIAKHLFERQEYYAQAHFTVKTDFKTPDDIANEIIHLLPH